MTIRAINSRTNPKPCAVVVNGARTSIRLEPEYWSALRDISKREHLTRSELFAFIASRRPGTSFTSAVREFIAHYYWELSTFNRENLSRAKAAPMPQTESAAPGY